MSGPDQLPPPSDQEWTFPKPKKTRRRPPPPKQPQRTWPLKSPQEIETEYLQIKQDWSTSPCCTSLRKLIASNGRKLSPVNRAICLGLGTFDPHDDSWESKRRTYRQYIAFVVMVEELEKFTTNQIECIFQEPLFTGPEKEFLTAKGHRVVDHPVACQSITEDSLLYGVHLYRELYQEALATNLPAIFVGTDWDTWDELMLQEPSLMRGVKSMHETYEKFQFPDDGLTFSSTALYWRPREAKGSEEDGEKVDENKDEDAKSELELAGKLEKVVMIS